MGRYDHGEIIALCWDGAPDALFVAGHMEPRRVAEILFGDYEDTYPFKDPVRAWARWSLEGPVDDYEGNCRLATYSSPGRGRFPIMCADIYRPGTKTEPGPLLAELIATASAPSVEATQ